MADEDLMALVARGEARAFEIIFDRHGDAAFSLAYRICGRRAVSEDVVQEAFLSLWRTGARHDRPRGSVRSWILAVVRGRAIDALRLGPVHERWNVDEDALVERVAAPDRTKVEVARGDQALLVRGALDELPIEQRRAIELAYFGGFTHAQIDEMLALPVGSVKGRIRLGLTTLRIAFADPTDVAV